MDKELKEIMKEIRRLKRELNKTSPFNMGRVMFLTEQISQKEHQAKQLRHQPIKE